MTYRINLKNKVFPFFALVLLFIPIFIPVTDCFAVDKDAVIRNSPRVVTGVPPLPINPSRSNEIPATIAEDVNVMAGVIEKILSERLQGHFQASDLFNKGVHGWYVKNMGVFFTCKVDFDVTTPIEEPTSEKENGETDLWDEVRSSLKKEKSQSAVSNPYKNVLKLLNENTGNPNSPIIESYIDSENERHEILRKLDKAIIEGIHRYGERIKGLRADNDIVVTVFGETNIPDMKATMLNYQREIVKQQKEKELYEKVKSIIDRIIGPDKYMLTVSVEMDWSDIDVTKQAPISETSYGKRNIDVEKQAPVAEKSYTETSSSAAMAGEPGVEGNVQSTGIGADGRETLKTKIEETIENYDYVKKEDRTSPDEKVKSKRVAIILDYQEWPGHTTQIPVPRETIEKLEKTIDAAIDFNDSRGDELSIETLQFRQNQDKSLLFQSERLGMTDNLFMNLQAQNKYNLPPFANAQSRQTVRTYQVKCVNLKAGADLEFQTKATTISAY